jgi:tRNA 2-selenouridine synthase
MAELPGIRPLSDYAVIIDARTPKEFAEDHLPGAVNLPVVTQEEFAEVGTLHRTDPHAAYLLGAQYALRNVACYIAEAIAPRAPSDRILIYCFRGGKRSRAWADPVRNIGYAVDLLPGGWKAYRAWVRQELARLPATLPWRVLSGSTATGKTRLLQALAREGEQVLDLEALAVHRGSLLGEWPAQTQPTQKRFDSALRHALARFDPRRPVWVEDESKRIGRLQLPTALFDAIRSAPVVRVEADLHARVALCRQDYAHFATDPVAMVQRLRPVRPLVGGACWAEWMALAEAGAVDTLFARLMTDHYDPCYARSASAKRPTMATVVLTQGPGDALGDAARGLLQRLTSTPSTTDH